MGALTTILSSHSTQQFEQITTVGFDIIKNVIKGFEFDQAVPLHNLIFNTIKLDKLAGSLKYTTFQNSFGFVEFLQEVILKYRKNKEFASKTKNHFRI